MSRIDSMTLSPFARQLMRTHRIMLFRQIVFMKRQNSLVCKTKLYFCNTVNIVQCLLLLASSVGGGKLAGHFLFLVLYFSIFPKLYHFSSKKMFVSSTPPKRTLSPFFPCFKKYLSIDLSFVLFFFFWGGSIFYRQFSRNN